jgi:hypothetical protein
MTSSKQAFLASQDKCDQWNAVALQAWFEDVLVHVRSDLGEGGNLSSEGWAGVNAFIQSLKTIGVKPPERTMPVTPRVERGPSEPRRRGATKKD